MKALPPLDTFENHRLGFQYNQRLNQSTNRVTEQNKRLMMIPGVFPFLAHSRQQHLAESGTPASVPSQTGSLSNQRPEVDFVDQALTDLKAFDPPTRKRALGRLMHAPVNADRRAEVAEEVAPMLRDPDSWTRGDAAKTLAVWGGPESVPALIEALKDPEFGVRWAVLDALKALKDPRAAGELAEMVAENKDRGKAVEALKAIGPLAEPAVIPLLRHGDMWVRREACVILKETGTEASVPSLKAIAMRNSGLDSMAAVEALNSMSLRNVEMNASQETDTGAGSNPFKKKKSQIFKRRP
jgi:HEAT repeat protein